MQTFKSGETVGNGAAINVELGWIPDYVEVINVTDGDKISKAFPNRMAIPFSSGGTTEIAAGATIVGATSAASAIVKAVLLYSGTWAGGDVAGFFIIERDTLSGTFASENVYISSDTTAGTNDATVTANVTHTVQLSAADAQLALVTGNDAISGYTGAAASNAKGFTIGSSVAEEAKLLRWTAWRNAS